jgi:hypothetical protein
VTFSERNEWIDGFRTDRMEGYPGIRMGTKWTKALKLGCTVMQQGVNVASSLGNAPQYSRQKCKP